MNSRFYIGEFLVEIFIAMEEYRRIYGGYPESVAVDSCHYRKIEESSYKGWIDTDTMTLMNGVIIVKEERYQGTFMSMRSEKYRRKI